MRRLAAPAVAATALLTGSTTAVIAGFDPRQLQSNSRVAAIDTGHATTQAGPAKGTLIAASAPHATTQVTGNPADRVMLGTVSRDRQRPTLPTIPFSSTIAPTPQPDAKRWRCVLPGCAGRIVSGFGLRMPPGGIGSTFHQGVDFAVPIGTPLIAMRPGFVVAAGPVDGLGTRIEIDYGAGLHVIYGHMSTISVLPRQTVTDGELVGWSGNTGRSTGPHLHFEVRVNGTAINPEPWLRARELL